MKCYKPRCVLGLVSGEMSANPNFAASLIAPKGSEDVQIVFFVTCFDDEVLICASQARKIPNNLKECWYAYINEIFIVRTGILLPSDGSGGVNTWNFISQFVVLLM
jgi:hypothetical protein